MQDPQSLNQAFLLAERASNIINYVEYNTKRSQPSTSTAVPMELGNIQSKGKQPINNSKKDVVCNYCKKKGHYKSECYALQRKLNSNNPSTSN